MMHIKDLDVENRRSWQGALGMIFTLCGEAADLSFDCRMLGSRNKLPTVEFRLDAPAELTLPHVASTADGTVEVWKYGTVILTDHIPAQVPEATTVFLLRPDGAAAVTYRAFKESVRVLTELKLPAEFSWSSIFLAPLCDDLSLTLAREAAAYAYGAMHTIWLRSSDDEAVKAAMTAMNRCGELRVQNMATANTWVSGSVDEAELLKMLDNRPC